jgi:hypothetical protein
MAFFLINLEGGEIEKPWHQNNSPSDWEKIIIEDRDLFVASGKLQEIPTHEASMSFDIFTLSQVLNQRTLVEIASIALENPGLAQERLRTVDGQFLVVVRDKKTHRALVISDRYGSRSVFWAIRGGHLVLSGIFHQLVSIFPDGSGNNLDKAAVFEYLWFRRLFGLKTYRKDIRLIPPGSITIFGPQNDVRSIIYWQPSSTSWQGDREECAESLASAIRAGVQLDFGSPKQSGLLLSGGLDARAILMAGQDHFSCFTNAPRFNNEVEIAASIAHVSSSPHHFIPRPGDYLDKIFIDACALSNGMTQYYECQFLGYIEELANAVDELQLGLFLDIFFCGHYMPKKHLKAFGRDSLFFVDIPLRNDQLIDQFIHNVSYRQKQTKLEAVVKPERFIDLYDEMRTGLDSEMQIGKEAGFSGSRLWEYMHLVNVGRHYSSLMANSVRGSVDVHLPALTIRCYELAFSIPPAWKKNWHVYLKALKRLDNQEGEFMAILNSNTNWPANRNLLQQTLLTYLRGGFRKIFPTLKGTPAHLDRSWPWVSQSLTERGKVFEKLQHLMKDGRIWDLDILEKPQVERLFSETMTGNQDHSIFLNQLLTLEYGALDSVIS